MPHDDRDRRAIHHPDRGMRAYLAVARLADTVVLWPRIVLVRTGIRRQPAAFGAN